MDGNATGGCRCCHSLSEQQCQHDAVQALFFCRSLAVGSFGSLSAALVWIVKMRESLTLSFSASLKPRTPTGRKVQHCLVQFAAMRRSRHEMHAFEIGSGARAWARRRRQFARFCKGLVFKHRIPRARCALRSDNRWQCVPTYGVAFLLMECLMVAPARVVDDRG